MNKLGTIKYFIVSALALFAITLYVYCLVVSRPLINRSFPGFTVLRNNLVPTMWMPGWDGFQQGIKFGDIVVAVQGPVDIIANHVTSGDVLNKYVASLKPGTVVNYTINRRGRELPFTVPVNVFSVQDYLILFPLFMSFGLFFYGMGLVVFFLKPRSGASWAFLFNGLMVGISLIAAPEYCTTHHNIVCLFTLPLVGPSFVILALYFPEPYRARKYIMAASLCTALPIVFFYVYFFEKIASFQIVDTIMLVHLSVLNSVAFLLIARSLFFSTNQFTRQQAKIVLYGIILTATGSTFFLVGNLMLKKMGFFWFLPFSLMFLPLSIGYAILATNLFDVDVFIRRSAGYVVATIISVTLLFTLMALTSFALQSLTRRSSQISSVFSTLVIVLIFRPLHQRINFIINRGFYRERYEYQQTIQKAGLILSSIIDLDELLKTILETVMDAVQIEVGGILLEVKEQGQFVTCVRRDYSEQFKAQMPDGWTAGAEVASISVEHPLIRRVAESGNAFHLTDLEGGHESGAGRDEILTLMQKMKFVLITPIIYEYRLTGLLGLGPKRTGAWYSSEDIDLLQTLMLQISVSIENARKVKELKKMVELETSYRSLKDLDQLKDSFLSMVSHDLRTPITGILGYAYLLHGLINEEKMLNYLDIIIEQTERLNRLLNDLLDFQRFEAGRMVLQFSDVALTQLIAESVSAFMAAASQNNLTLCKNLPDDKIIISGHRDRLQQVMANLISNAIKFTPGEGRITVRAMVISTDGPREVKVSVIDTGPGIPREFQGSLFNKFQQVPGGEAKNQIGSGLGLALVRHIIESHQGRVGLESEPGLGSEFFFFLPLKEIK